MKSTETSSNVTSIITGEVMKLNSVRGIFLAATVLISAPAYADPLREFSAFLDEYRVYSEKRAIQAKSHTARFGSALSFREEQCDEGASCECPSGNKYIQCLYSARGTITTDPNDIGGRGYILVVAAGSALNTSGKWVPLTTRGVYTASVERLGTSHSVNIQIPDRATIDALCAGNNSGPIEFTVGYGAVMPMEMEFAARMKERSAAMGQSYDEQGFVFSRARTNGSRAKKGAVAGAAECRPVAG